MLLGVHPYFHALWVICAYVACTHAQSDHTFVLPRLTKLLCAAAVAATIMHAFALTSSRVALSTLLGVVTVMLMVRAPFKLKSLRMS